MTSFVNLLYSAAIANKLLNLGDDFKNVLRDKNADKVWDEALASMKVAAELSPAVVAAGKLDGMFVPNHLTTMGFYLLRARTQLKEISAILTK